MVRSKFDDRKVVFVLVIGKIFASIGKRHILINDRIIIFLAIFFLGILANFYGQLLYSVLFGFMFGSYCSSVVVYLKTFSDDLATSYGVYLFVSSMSSIVSPALVGRLYHNVHYLFNISFQGYCYDTWKNYRIAYFSLAGTVLSSALVLSLQPLIDHQKKRNYIKFPI